MLALTPHTTDRCPVAPDATVAYHLAGDHNTYFETAGSLFWGHPAAGEPGRISAYALIEVCDAPAPCVLLVAATRCAGHLGRSGESPGTLEIASK
jgi:hypothetical protein